MIFKENIIEKFLKEHNLFNSNEVQLAFSHKSVGEKNYEKLEFLGDAVLNLFIVNYLIKNNTEYEIGDLAKIKSYLVSKEVLYKIGKKNNIFNFIKYGLTLTKKEIVKNKRIISDVVEAIIGAIYINLGFNETTKFIYELYKNEFKNIKNKMSFNDYKSELQNMANKNFKSLPEYRLIKTDGLEHKKTFYVDVFLDNKKYGSGKGKTIKEAEQEAAKIALKKFKK
jgi:ribonuclease-3